MDELIIKKEQVVPLLETKFLKVYDLQYAEGKHYYNATRHNAETLTAVQPKDAFCRMLPDAVTCIVILQTPEAEPRLLLSYEYRYPAGQYLLSPPAGLLDPEDRSCPEPLFAAAAREIREETGIILSDEDRLSVVNPLAFSSPGMTDESNALVCAVVHLPDLTTLNQNGAVGSERFDGFCLLTGAEAREILKSGRDANGMFYSIYTFAALTWFAAGLWEA